MAEACDSVGVYGDSNRSQEIYVVLKPGSPDDSRHRHSGASAISVPYGAIGWNRQKKFYDVTLISLIALYLGIFVAVGAWRNPNATAETLLIRGLRTAAFLRLNVVLCIGPLSHLDPRFLPLLYKRRHLGVRT